MISMRGSTLALLRTHRKGWDLRTGGGDGLATRRCGYRIAVTFLYKFLRRFGWADDRIRLAEWKVVSTLSGLLAGVVVRRLLNLLWAKASPSDHTPPLNAADREIGWGEALSWSVATGVGVGVARVVSDRLAASTWEMATGSPPPGVRTE